MDPVYMQIKGSPAENAPDGRFCKSCWEELLSVFQTPAIVAPEQESPQAPV